MNDKYCGFETGPIRPPSEAESLLVRVTRNCPWNQCSFCSLYKGEVFSRRPIEDVLRDVDTVKYYIDELQCAKKEGRPLSSILLRTPEEEEAWYAAANFYNGGMRSIFLQDANSLIIKPEEMIRLLRHLRTLFPDVERVTTYGRSKTIARISDEDLLSMAEAGLNRVHIGMESACDAVLARVKKGADKAAHIAAGLKVKGAGIQLSEYYIPGLGGRSLSREHALETAEAMSLINPDYIRLRTLGLPAGAPLSEEYRRGEFDKMGEVETAAELLLFLENLKGVTSHIPYDHVLNLFQEVDGQLPEDRKKILTPIRFFLQLPACEQMLFALGRRTHRMARLSDLDNPALREPVERWCREIGATTENMDGVIDGIMQQFI